MSFKEAGARMIARLEAADLAIKREFFSRILIDTPVDTGEARGGWNVSVDSPDYTRDGTLDKDCSIGIGKIMAMGQEHVGAVSWYANAVPHIVELEYGKSSQAPQGVVRVNVAAFEHLVHAVVEGLG